MDTTEPTKGWWLKIYEAFVRTESPQTLNTKRKVPSPKMSQIGYGKRLEWSFQKIKFSPHPCQSQLLAYSTHLPALGPCWTSEPVQGIKDPKSNNQKALQA
jgi:hypothetical protein